MKNLIILFAVLLNYSYCKDGLLGGWSITTDDALIQDSLRKALINISGGQVDDDLQSKVSNIVCNTQIVNGLNIKLNFVLREQKWQCSLYKSFIQTLDTQVEQCTKVDDEQLSDDDEKEEPAALNDDSEDKIDTVNQHVSEEDAKDDDEQQQQ